MTLCLSYSTLVYSRENIAESIFRTLFRRRAQEFNKFFKFFGSVRRVSLVFHALLGFFRRLHFHQHTPSYFFSPLAMARALRQDIPSRRARHAMPQLAPGMADLNPAPGVGRTGPPPLDSLDQAPAGSFQANRALNGERGVAARQQARLHHRFSGGSATSREPVRASPPFDWDPDAFPADSDLFGSTSTGTRRLGPLQSHMRDDRSSLDVPPHSARVRHDSGLEGGGADVPRGRGPVRPSSPDSTDSVPSEWGGIDGEDRVLDPPALGPPFELHSTREPAFSSQPPNEAEQFRTASRSQSRLSLSAVAESPNHEKVTRTRFLAGPSPRKVQSQEDGGRPSPRLADHTRRRSRSLEPMDMEVVHGVGDRTRSFAFPDPRTARYLDADPVGMLTSVSLVVIKVLAEGWQEVIPLGHFARRFNPLISGHARVTFLPCGWGTTAKYRCITVVFATSRSTTSQRRIGIKSSAIFPVRSRSS
ncbi:hypothetical protein F5878DRAFT_68930 [Lentinula raphanica]|uniref:Uncharacterized protein n=1 Tax=Lentinula raphanica TaxID=153919 RepID=A0AA38PD49_9AGAR|nr:hypothetical protein F5878DRAFT_68930 [Lentinula raphanica]